MFHFFTACHGKERDTKGAITNNTIKSLERVVRFILQDLSQSLVCGIGRVMFSHTCLLAASLNFCYLLIHTMEC